MSGMGVPMPPARQRGWAIPGLAHRAQPCEGCEAAGQDQNRQLMRGGRA